VQRRAARLEAAEEESKGEPEEELSEVEDEHKVPPQPRYELVERRAPGATFSAAPRQLALKLPPPAAAEELEPPRTPPRNTRGAVFGTAPRKSDWLPSSPAATIPASPAPTELSDAATDIAPLSDLDAAVRPHVPAVTMRLPTSKQGAVCQRRPNPGPLAVIELRSVACA